MQLWYAAATAAAIGGWACAIVHGTSATARIHRPLWDSNLSLRDKCVHFLTWHGASWYMTAGAFVFTLPVLNPTTAMFHRSAVALSASFFTFGGAFSLAESLYWGQPGLLALIYVGFSFTGIAGLIAAYCIP